MSFLESVLTFLAAFLSWYWPILVLALLDYTDVYGRFLQARIGPGLRSVIESIPANRSWKTGLLLATAFLAAGGAYHGLRLEKEAQDARLVRLEAELFRVGVVYSEKLDHVSDTTWRAKNDIGKVIGLSVDGSPVVLAPGLFETKNNRIQIRGGTLEQTSRVELVYMARHTAGE